MTTDQIIAHLNLFREKQERQANEELAKQEQARRVFEASCNACTDAFQSQVEPLLRSLSETLTTYGHENIFRPLQETEHVTERTKLKSKEFAASIAVERPKGTLILRMVANPQNREIAATIGVPHGNCSSVFHAASGPLTEAEEITNRGIADFMASAFPTR